MRTYRWRDVQDKDIRCAKCGEPGGYWLRILSPWTIEPNRKGDNWQYLSLCAHCLEHHGDTINAILNRAPGAKTTYNPHSRGLIEKTREDWDSRAGLDSEELNVKALPQRWLDHKPAPPEGAWV